MKMYDNPWAPTSYTMNFIMNYGAFNAPAETRLGRRTMHGFYSSTFMDGRVFDVSKVTFLMDCDTWNWGWGSPEFGYWTDHYVYTTSKYPYRHPGERANILYFDGHIGAERHRENGGPRNWTWKYP
jgi:prepilin-type processing-associated H-X9-DG protein